MVRLILLTIILNVFSASAYANAVRKLNYSGRLTEINGKPVVGPIDLQVQFFRNPSGGAAIGGAIVPVFYNVPLAQGVFEVSIDLSPEDMNTVFDGNAVFIQITDLTHSQTYPRQEFSVTPYALKVPVDGTSISYNTDGELTVIGAGSGSISEITAGDGLSGGGNTATINLSIADSGVSTNKIAANAVDSSKLADAAVTLTKIAACANSDEILKWNGSAWICAADEIGASGTGDITSVAAADGLSGGATTGDVTVGIAANGVSTNRLADAAVETAKIANNAVDDTKLANGAVTLAKLAACNNTDEILKWNGSAWTCGADVDTNSGGDITGMTAGAGLTGTAASGEATLSIVDEGVTTAKIANAAVINDKLANASVSSDKIINAAVGTTKSPMLRSLSVN